MEKDVALREWCVEKAMVLLQTNPAAVGFTVADVVGIAKDLEIYILIGYVPTWEDRIKSLEE